MSSFSEPTMLCTADDGAQAHYARKVPTMINDGSLGLASLTFGRSISCTRTLELHRQLT